VDNSCEPVRLKELERWVARQRNFDREDAERKLDSQNYYGFSPAEREVWLQEKRTLEYSRSQKIDLYYAMLENGNKTVKQEFDKVFDVNLIVELGKKVFENMSNDNLENRKLLSKIPTRKKFAKDWANREKEIKLLEGRLQAGINYTEKVGEGLRRLEIQELPELDLTGDMFDFERELLGRFGENQKLIAIKAIRWTRISYQQSLVNSETQADLTGSNFDDLIKRKISDALEIQKQKNKASVSKLQKDYIGAIKKINTFADQLEISGKKNSQLHIEL
jgi:hypothetical protein